MYIHNKDVMVKTVDLSQGEYVAYATHNKPIYVEHYNLDNVLPYFIGLDFIGESKINFNWDVVVRIGW